MFKVTNEQKYWDYIQKNIPHLPKEVLVRLAGGGLKSGYSFAEFGWDAKYAGINVLVSGVII